MPNYASLSNVPATQTLPADTQPPTTVTDLRVLGMHIRMAKLAWTAPADLGDSGTKAYELRLQHQPHRRGQLGRRVARRGSAGPGGGRQHGVGCGDRPAAQHHVLLRRPHQRLGGAEQPLGCLQRAVGHHPRAIQSVLVRNPWLSSDRIADCRSLDTMAATFDKAYTPDGVIVPGPTDIQARAINSYNNFKRREYHWADDPPNRGDVVRNMNVYGWSLCGGQATQNASILERMGIGVRTGSVANGAHTLYEVFWDNDWHLMDTMTTMYVFDRANPPSIASAADIKADKTLMTSAVAEGRACPGFLLCPDDVTWFANGTNSWSIIGTPGSTAVTHSMNMDLRFGETLDRTWEAWANQHPTPKTNADSMPGNDPPYHHDCHNDWKDTVNFKYWEPYGTIYLAHPHQQADLPALVQRHL